VSSSSSSVGERPVDWEVRDSDLVPEGNLSTPLLRQTVSSLPSSSSFVDESNELGFADEISSNSELALDLEFESEDQSRVEEDAVLILVRLLEYEGEVTGVLI